MDKKISPPPLRTAATIILLREKNSDLEVYLLKRSAKSRFMAGVFVFPGGVVEPEDNGFETWAPHIDIDKKTVAATVSGAGQPPEEALGFCIAGIRETLEEAGVFMAERQGKTSADIKAMAEYRLRDDLSRSWFRDKILEEKWTLSLSRLSPWAHWITPVLVPKRFDTRFFIARMPEDQHCVPDAAETEKGIWISPQKALDQNIENSIPLSPPTIACLTRLSKFTTLSALESALDTLNHQEPVMPRAINSAKGPVVLMPWDPMYDAGADTLDEPPGDILAPGKKFSRVWNNKGIWLPVGV